MDGRRDLKRKEAGRGTGFVPILSPDPFTAFFFLPLDRSAFLAPPHTFRQLPSLLPFSLCLFSSCASFGFMYCACTCWIAASECTHEGLQDFQSFVATAAFPPHTSPSSRPPSHSFPLMGAETHTFVLLC